MKNKLEKSNLLFTILLQKQEKVMAADKGLIGGILGFSVEDERIKNAAEYAKDAGIEIEFETEQDPESIQIL